MPGSIHPFSTHSVTPQDYNDLIEELNRQVSAQHPEDVLQFCCDFFQHKLSEERLQNRNPTLVPVHNPNDVFMQESTINTIDEEQDSVSDDLPNFQSARHRNRRVSVSAESMQPSKLTPGSTLHKKIPKSEPEIAMISQSLRCHFLFKSLEEDQCRQVIDSMQEKKFHAGETIIEQGAVGDFFYIVSSGDVDCFVNNIKVTSYQRGGSFGELALMYNAPRAATLKAISEVTLWALDRVSFRSILMENNAKKRKMHEKFLEDVPLFKSLELSEIHKIADALEPVNFDDGDIVLNEGDIGDNFYLIEQGEALFYKSDGTNQQLVNDMKKGDYFGELALLTDKPRAATVVAKGNLRCVTLGKAAFTRLLGPVMDILKRNTANYHAILKEAQS
ncbi:cAMP dependent protein kinase regulatory subunit [Helicostylum pulchrum]|uniref:cAMP-dependent protein kinase regulatory subunit n=1 Tax=Helicostylum pulchrum TaxID=562976 RepID=A0ABP9XY01_9FUNG|nr:cAMP dependent protein kinase regulatory subunit [Helicostylum pulchrum]